MLRVVSVHSAGPLESRPGQFALAPLSGGSHAARAADLVLCARTCAPWSAVPEPRHEDAHQIPRTAGGALRHLASGAASLSALAHALEGLPRRA
jgi:hypothetical protein